MSEASATRAGRPAVAVIGATGHTGRFVVEELLRRELEPIAIARDPEALERASFSGAPLRRYASVTDPRSLDSALAGAGAVVNCAGPFTETAAPVATAALRAGIHYVDVTGEEPTARAVLDEFDAPAKRAGVAVLPSVGFYGAFSDLLVTAALGDWDSSDSVDVLIGLDSWRPTLGTRNTLALLSAPRGSASQAQSSPSPSKRHWDFGIPLGDQLVVEFALTEKLLIQRHVRTSALKVYLSSVAIGDVSDPATPAPVAVDDVGRSAQRFVVDVVVTRGSARRCARARGVDIYAFTAPLVCEVVEHLLDGRFRAPGAHAPGEILDATAILRALGRKSLDITFAHA